MERPLTAPESPQQLVRRILSYFLRNPQAADTLEGVARWRLLEETVYQNLEETKRALDWLVSAGFLVELEVPGSERVFRLNRGKGDDGRRLLGQLRGSGSNNDEH